MFLLLPQGFEVVAYNGNKDILGTVTYDADVKPLVDRHVQCKDRYLGNPRRFPTTDSDSIYSYINIFVPAGVAAIKKITLKAVGAKPLKIDNFTVASYADLLNPATQTSG